jgi:adenine phosphoribosyltransferase
MSTAPEAILAREANVKYAVIAMVTDYDCWKKTQEPVTWQQIERIMQQNSENVKKLLIRTIEKFTAKDSPKKHLEYIRNSIRTIPHFPKQGVMFRDITTLLKDPQAMKKVMDILVNKYKDKNIDVVTGIESRGFIFGSLLAEKIGASFVPVRKRGKLPAEKETQEYELEYGSDAVEIHKDAIKPGQKVVVVDDLIATGGTAAATADLVEKLGGKVEELAFVIELPDLKGREKLHKHNVYSIVSFEGE